MNKDIDRLTVGHFDFDLTVDISKTDGVFVEIEDLDKVYESISDKATIINDYDPMSQLDQNDLDGKLLQEYESNRLDSTPVCSCGALYGQDKRDVQCGDCGEFPVSFGERELEAILWARPPEGVKAFINPQVWNLFERSFKNVDNVLMWLVDSTYKPPQRKNRKEGAIAKLVKAGVGRGLNNFIENFDEIIDILINNRVIIKKHRRDLRIFVDENRDKIFPKHIPVPSKSLFIVEKKTQRKAIDDSVRKALDTVRNFTHIRKIRDNLAVREKATVKAISQMSEFYSKFFKENFGKKPGIYRRNAGGSSLDHTARSVISSISGPHDIEELHLPWAIGVTLLKTHIMGVLYRMGYSENGAEHLVRNHVKSYHPLLDDIMTKLVERSEGGFIPALFQRNPTLRLGSAKFHKITYIKGTKKRPWLVTSDTTISISTLVLKSYNADFDGDEMNLIMARDKHERKIFELGRHHRSIMDTNKVDTISKNNNLTTQVQAQYISFIHANDRDLYELGIL